MAVPSAGPHALWNNERQQRKNQFSPSDEGVRGLRLLPRDATPSAANPYTKLRSALLAPELQSSALGRAVTQQIPQSNFMAAILSF